MYDYIKGTLTECNSNYIVLETEGIGYKIFIPHNDLSQLLKNMQQNLQVYVSFIVREDAQILYGFSSKATRDFFEKLISISGVGPKIAMQVLGHFELGILVDSIRNADSRLISKIPGIGKKTAERIIIEIKDKLTGISLPSQSSKDPIFSDAIHALIHLGYPPSRAQKAISSVYDQKLHTDISSLITDALKKL